MAEENVPLSWYAILNAGNNIQPYLDAFELLQDPRLEPHDINGQQFGKLTSSDFARYKDYEEVLNKTRELVALLTGILRVRGQGPPLAIVNILGIFANGREKQFPPYGRGVRMRVNLGFPQRKPGVAPRPTPEQYIMEHVIRSDDQRVKEVLRYLSHPPDFFNLFKVLEVISLDLGRLELFGKLGDDGLRKAAYRGW